MYAWERGGAADEEQATSPQAGSTRHPFLPRAHTLIFNHLEVYPSTPSTKCNNLTKEPHSWVRFFFLPTVEFHLILHDHLLVVVLA